MYARFCLKDKNITNFILLGLYTWSCWEMPSQSLKLCALVCVISHVCMTHYDEGIICQLTFITLHACHGTFALVMCTIAIFV